VLSPPEAEAQRYSVYSLYSYRSSLYSYRSSVSTRACSRLPNPLRSGTQFTRLAAVSVYSLSRGTQFTRFTRFTRVCSRPRKPRRSGPHFTRFSSYKSANTDSFLARRAAADAALLNAAEDAAALNGALNGALNAGGGDAASLSLSAAEVASSFCLLKASYIRCLRPHTPVA